MNKNYSSIVYFLLASPVEPGTSRIPGGMSRGFRENVMGLQGRVTMNAACSLAGR
jgi:hypothetical protein